MHPAVEVRHDKHRGCGWRRPGLYLISEGLWSHCGMLPIPLDFCPCCGSKIDAASSVISSYKGLNLSRGWTWIEGKLLREHAPVCNERKGVCARCTLNRLDRAGMMWVGEAFYKTPANFMAEVLAQGLSKRLSSLPNGFKVGRTPVALAHRHVIHTEVKDPDTGKVRIEWLPGIFGIFTPTHVEYVVKGDETDAQIEAMLARGITPVTIERVQDVQTTMVRDEDAALEEA